MNKSILKIVLTAVRCYDENEEKALEEQFIKEFKENGVSDVQVEDLCKLGEVQGVIVITRQTEFCNICYRKELRDQVSHIVGMFWEHQESFSVYIDDEEIYDESDFDYYEVHKE